MNLSLRYFFLFLVITTFPLAGLFTVATLIYFSYQTSVASIVDEKKAILLIAEHDLQREVMSPPRLKPGADEIISVVMQSPDVVFFRVVHPSNGTVLASSHESEIGKILTNLPEFRPQPVSREEILNNRPVREISLLGVNGLGLWLGVDLQSIQQRVLGLAAIVFAVMLAVIGLAQIIIYAVVKRTIFRPFDTLIKRIDELGKGNLDIVIPDESSIQEVTELARSLNKMKEGFKNIHERDLEISKIKTEFISVAAHRLRTPLTSMKWAMKMLLNGDLGELKREQKEFIEKTYESNDRIIQLVNDLLDVARVEEGKYSYQFSEANIVEIIETVITEQNFFAKNREVSVVFREPETPITPFELDRERIKLALENLIENAIRYTSPSGKVEVKTEILANKRLQVSISDSGIGIPKDQMAYLFTKFFRGRNALRVHTEGTGLGLYITRNIIATHGGEIWATSEEGKGSTFYFTLPLKKSTPPKGGRFDEFMQGF